MRLIMPLRSRLNTSASTKKNQKTNHKRKNAPKLALFLGALLISTSGCHAGVDNTPPPALNTTTATTINNLVPSREQIITSFQVQRILKGHYTPHKIDDELSESLFHQYLLALDPNKNLFLASDIQQFKAYEDKLDDLLKKGDLSVAFTIYQRYIQRLEEAVNLSLSLIDNGIDGFDYTKKETMLFEHKDAGYPKDERAFKALWRKRVKSQVLNLLLSDESPKDIQEKLHKRFTNQLNRLHRTQSDDIFERYMNALTASYDPHTSYFSPHLSENFKIQMSLQLQGIGAQLTTEDEFTKIVKLIPGGPAEASNELHASDRIIGVGQGENGKIEDIIGWRIGEVVDKIRGKKGSVVRLLVIPHNAVNDTDTKIVRIVRDKIKLEDSAAKKYREIITVDGKDMRLGVIELPSFYLDFKRGSAEGRSTTRDVKRLINELKAEGIDGLVIDLRNNGGGSLEEVRKMVGLFIEKGPVVLTKYSDGSIESLRDDNPSITYDGPLAVMVNRLSASASEIFAAAIKDYGRGIIIGNQTFGKGTVQTIGRNIYHGQVKLTTAKFYRINGGSTQHKGVLPDITFPTLYDKTEIGENILDNSLAWDTIKSADYKTWGNIAPYLKKLTASHQKRVKTDPDFIYLNDKVALIDKHRDKKTFSLNLAKRQQELADNEAEQLLIENKFRQATGKKPISALSDLDDEADADKEDDNDSSTKDNDEKIDAFAKEAGRILFDFVALSNPRNNKQAK